MNTKNSAKKRLMFIQKEDYNFLTYNLLLVLKGLGAISESSKFKDFRKIAYLIHFVNFNPDFNKYDKLELATIYSKAQLKKQLISHLLVILKNRDYIGVSINIPNQSFDLWVNLDKVPQDFLNNELFEKEIKNIFLLKSKLPRVKIITVKNLVDIIFTKNNVITWEI